MCFTETWLREDIDDGCVNIDGFSLIRSDRNKDSGKQTGGGVCMYINDRWANNWTVKKKLCTPNIELLTVGVRPFYLPREFTQIFFLTVYIPPHADSREAASETASEISTLESDHPDAVKIITGDFNSCTLDGVLPNYTQYVSCHTREDKTLDLCYVNTPDAYLAHCKPPLGRSDHNIVHLVPRYRQLLKRQKQIVRSVKQWNKESSDELRGCFECTLWNVLTDDSDLDNNVEVVSDYINFCEDMIIPKKEVKFYPNNKPWVTKGLKETINKKKSALAKKDKLALKTVGNELKIQIRSSKDQFKHKLEAKFKSTNTKEAWQGLRQITGFGVKARKNNGLSTESAANELNEFYARFDKYDFSQEQEKLHSELILKAKDCDHMEITKESVVKCMGMIKPNKACGPDNIGGRVLKECKLELAPVLQGLFQKSLDSHKLPAIWKISHITPVPKKPQPKVNNDYRPVALTSIVMKCFERIIVSHLLPLIKPILDPHQFAYRANRSVDDATLTLVHHLYQHLDTGGHHARVLMVDFSSAFNTIQPHLMMQKLMSMALNPNIILWVQQFLTGRLQRVCLGSTRSGTIRTNTGAPQGCVISPVLFTLYTNDCVSTHDSCEIIKYADDTAILGKLSTNPGRHADYLNCITDFTDWCTANFLELNVSKTKELIFDFRRSQCPVQPVTIGTDTVEIVNEYKYLGTIIDNQLNWSSNIRQLYSKCQQRLYFLRKLNEFHIDHTIMHLFYTSVIQSIFAFCILVYYGNASSRDIHKVHRIIKQAQKVTQCQCQSIHEIYNIVCTRKVRLIVGDEAHPLHQFYSKLRSGIRFKSMRGRTKRYLTSFVPASITHFNSLCRR